MTDTEDKGRRQGQEEEEELFEDLDQFFAPLDDAGWAEQEEEGSAPPPAGPPPGAAEAGEAEDWDLEIEVPEEEELLAAGPTEAAAGDESVEVGATAGPGGEQQVSPPDPDVTRGDEPAAPEGPSVDEEEDEPPRAEDLSAAPPEYVDLPQDEEEPVLSTEDLFEEPGPPEPVDALAGPAVTSEPEPGEDQEPEPEQVEAAAEHFATGLRESPEEVERELLADLEEPDEDVTAAIESGPGAEPAPPTWQEGAEPIEEIPPEAAPRAPIPVAGRNLVAAFGSGIILAIAVVLLLVVGDAKGPFTVFVALVVLLGQAELYAVMRTRQLQPATLLGLVSGALMVAGAYLRGPAAVLLGLFLCMALTVLWYMVAPAASRRNTTVNAGATILGAVYVPFLASFAVLLLAEPGDLGRNIFLVVVGLTALYDVSAYAVGTLWGSRPLAPTISPQKSWEGAIGATFVLLLVSLAIVPSIEPFTSSRAVGLALVIAVVAPLGDLVESAIKRDLGVKDMGTILPGHGGILDRVDAILFAAPAAYYFLQLSF